LRSLDVYSYYGCNNMYIYIYTHMFSPFFPNVERRVPPVTPQDSHTGSMSPRRETIIGVDIDPAMEALREGNRGLRW